MVVRNSKTEDFTIIHKPTQQKRKNKNAPPKNTSKNNRVTLLKDVKGLMVSHYKIHLHKSEHKKTAENDFYALNVF